LFCLCCLLFNNDQHRLQRDTRQCRWARRTPPGDSATYINPNTATDHTVSINDWVFGRPGVANSKGVRDALDALKALTITVPVWDTATGQGSNTQYHIIGFARLQITGYQLPGQDRITAIYRGTATCQ